MKKTYLCVHGHFYQPPRENPWTEAIESQDQVGGGFHDWNERILAECYRPNVLARILDVKQKIETIVNNFEFISFNVGPTLLSWLEIHDERVYQLILEADKKSRLIHHGHGNALAQAYNHVIMPLANRRDKITQVRWGLRDFKKRFGRDPEGLWLPETACNQETLEVLIEEGIKFIILAPHQAQQIRHFNDGNWQDVSSGNIDPTRSYRCFIEKPNKFIDIFFYDGPVSKAVAFDELTNDAKIFAGRLEATKNPARQHVELINVATDGETYGHHKTYGDRALAYLLNVEAPKRGFVLTNYGEYLEKFPSEHEVVLKTGENNAGTSWSCFHGVKRWYEDCGCRGGGPGHWKQTWRKPLRETFDWLRDEIAPLYEKELSSYLKDPWGARDEYIDIILERTETARQAFLKRHAKYQLSEDDVVKCLRLLEMQRNLMLMYTSCGWFFTEISGEETVQVIKYATRAIQLFENAFHQDLTQEFLKRLGKAPSNMENLKNGEGVYEHLVRPSIVTLEKVVSHYAISSLFHSNTDSNLTYCYEFDNVDSRKESAEDLTLCYGRVNVRSVITAEKMDAVFVLLQSELYDFFCYVRPFAQLPDYYQLCHELFSEFSLGHHNKMGKMIYEYFGRDYFSLKDLFKDEKKFILNALSKDGLKRFKEFYEDIFQTHKRMIDVCRLSQIPLPEEYRFVVEHKLSDDFNQLVTEKIFSSPALLEKAYAIYLLAKESGLELNDEPSRQFLTKKFNKIILEISNRWFNDKIKDCLQILKVKAHVGIEMDLNAAQEYYLSIVQKLENDQAFFSHANQSGIMDFIELGHQLNINMERIQPGLKKLLSHAPSLS